MENTLFSLQAGVTDKDELILSQYIMAVKCYCIILFCSCSMVHFIFTLIFINLTLYIVSAIYFSWFQDKKKYANSCSKDAQAYIHFNPTTFAFHLFLFFTVTPSLVVCIYIFWLDTIFIFPLSYNLSLPDCRTSRERSLVFSSKEPTGAKNPPTGTMIMQFLLHAHVMYVRERMVYVLCTAPSVHLYVRCLKQYYCYKSKSE